MAITKFDGDHFFLSNFFPAPLEFEGMMFKTSEHAFQAMKTEDLDERRWVADQQTAGQAKRAGELLADVASFLRGRKITLRPDWNEIRVDVMENIVREKFRQNPHLIDELIATGSEDLIEGNNWNDTFWGVCSGNGANWLGRILMKLRFEFKPD